ncbi:unnamed protein product [Closterium sp. Naga37s-1]|nr:unnamed protein product [Closterium sp. Naga37s-1]
MSPESIPLGLSSLRSLSALSATPLWPPPPIAEWPRAAADHGPRIATAAIDVADRLLTTVPPLLTQALTSAAAGVHRYLQRFSVYVTIANAARPVLRPAVDKAQEVLDKTTTMPIRVLWLWQRHRPLQIPPAMIWLVSVLLLLAGIACTLPLLLSTLHAPPPPRPLPCLSLGPYPAASLAPTKKKLLFIPPTPPSPALSLPHPTLSRTLPPPPHPLPHSPSPTSPSHVLPPFSSQIPPMSTIPGRLIWLTILLLLAWAACTLPSLLSTLHDPQYYSASPFPRRIPVLGDGGSAPVFSDTGFNVEAAAKMWEAKVGCARFRWKHRDLLKKYSYSSAFPKSSSLQDPNRVACRRMQLRHVTILLPPGAESWMWPHKLEGFYHCPRCGITCQISWSPLMALQADATLHVWPADPPADRTRGQPLRVYLNLESWGLQEKRRLFDVGVSPFASSDVQLTYSGVHHTLETGRRQFFSKIKRQDVPLYRASSHCQYEWREGLVRDVFALVPHHSFGHCHNNMNGSDAELLLYPECSHPVISVLKQEISACAMSHYKFIPTLPLPTPPTAPPDILKQEISACAMSHYKFILSTENTHVPGYVTEKALEPLEAGTVPVYYGAPDIHHFMPPESFIDGSKYTAAHLATLITALNNDPAEIRQFMLPESFINGSKHSAAHLATPITVRAPTTQVHMRYMNYFAWRMCGVPGPFAHVTALNFDSFPCRLCEAVSARGGRMF